MAKISLPSKALLSLAVLPFALSPSCLSQTPSTSPPTKADTVLINGTILTVDPKDSIAEALAIRAGKIIAIGSKQQILALTDANTQVLDLHGRTATPGLIDTHGHYQDGGVDELYNIELTDATSVAEIVRRVEARVAITKPGEWILGSGWDEGKLAENRYVYASDLDKISPNNPVWLQNITGHYSAVNSYALRLAHITAESKDPPAGTIDRDSSGAVTGVLKEQANVAMLALIPLPSIDHRKQGILKSIDDLHREGMTSIKDIGSPYTWTAYKELLSEGKLDERVCMLWRADNTPETAKAALTEIQKNPRPPQSLGDGRLVACGAKIFMDGSTAARTAWVYEPWHKNSTEIDKGNFGYPNMDPEVYRQMVRLFHQAGVTVGTHAIGDRAIDWVVDTYALVLKETPTRASVTLSFTPISPRPTPSQPWRPCRSSTTPVTPKCSRAFSGSSARQSPTASVRNASPAPCPSKPTSTTASAGAEGPTTTSLPSLHVTAYGLRSSAKPWPAPTPLECPR